MSSRLSFHNCWLPRTVFFQRIFSCSTFSTKPVSNNASSHRSTSHFSLKIARFLFLKRRIKYDASKTTITQTHTDTHDSKIESNQHMHLLARSFLFSLEPEQLRILHDELIYVEKLSTTTTTPITIPPSQLAVVFLETGLPYIGFGFVDNFVMLVAGETIETFFGAAFCLSTMAAAGFGNAVSDVMGIG
ncbi:unnamed protein product [Rotaria sp. Silwood1]|nr:unnamed protein product [Rotaria sp. Silwood1]